MRLTKEDLDMIKNEIENFKYKNWTRVSDFDGEDVGYNFRDIVVGIYEKEVELKEQEATLTFYINTENDEVLGFEVA